MRNKKWTILFLTMCLVLVTAGCGQKDNNAGESKGSANGGSDKVTVNFMHLWPEGVSAGQNKIVNQIIKEYQTEHPNVVIKQEVLDNEQYKNKLKVLSASNELPDVGVTWAAGFLQPYVEGNLFAPVDDLLNGELKDKFVAGTTEAYAINDKTYALPLEFNIAPIYYNKAIFEKYNLEVPQTYDQFKQVVKTLSEGALHRLLSAIRIAGQDRFGICIWLIGSQANRHLQVRSVDQAHLWMKD